MEEKELMEYLIDGHKSYLLVYMHSLSLKHYLN